MLLSPFWVSDSVGESLEDGADSRDTQSSALIAQSCKPWSRSIETAGRAAYRLSNMQELAALTAKYSNGDGIHQTAIDALTCIRLSAPHLQLPAVYQPSICVIAQGTKQVLLENEIYGYAPPQFLAVSVDLPLTGQVTEASAEKPYLCLAIAFDARQMTDLIAQTGDASWSRGQTSRGLFVGEMDGAMQEATLRLARLLDTPLDIPVLAPLALREFHYRLLKSPYGPAIAQMAIAGSNTHKIAQAIRRIKTQLATPIQVEELATMANMSPSSFHQHFKAVTAMSPVQYQKRLRLTEARHILLAENADAASAAYRVGYQSVSQFSREYARMFGAPPKRDAENIRGVSAA
jgi:AraC-like DNA-binding protein